jgi:hypothetical protein
MYRNIRQSWLTNGAITTTTTTINSQQFSWFSKSTTTDQALVIYFSAKKISNYMACVKY